MKKTVYNGRYIKKSFYNNTHIDELLMSMRYKVLATQYNSLEKEFISVFYIPSPNMTVSCTENPKKTKIELFGNRQDISKMERIIHKAAKEFKKKYCS